MPTKHLLQRPNIPLQNDLPETSTMKYKLTTKTKHTEKSIHKLDPVVIDECTIDIFDLEEAKERAKKTAISYITDPKNERIPGITANNGYSIRIEEEIP